MVNVLSFQDFSQREMLCVELYICCMCGRIKAQEPPMLSSWSGLYNNLNYFIIK